MANNDTKRFEKNFNTLLKMANQLGDRSQPAIKLLNTMANEISIAPASTRISYHHCYAGGLVEYILQCLRNAQKLNTQFNFGCSEESIIFVCLFHAIGKAGDLEGPMYVPQTSEWHRDVLGQLYKIREDIWKMSVADRSLWLLNYFGVCLRQDEWIAIRASDRKHCEEEESYYAYDVPALATLLEMSIKLSIL